MNNFIITHDKSSLGFNKIKININNSNVKNVEIFCCIWGNISNKSNLIKMLKKTENKIISQEKLVVELYKLKGVSVFKLIKGRISCCLVDVVRNHCYILKSNMSEIQFYYKNDDSGFVLSNSLTSILETFNNRINKTSVQLYIYLRYIPAPYTIIQDISKLEPGKLLIYDSSSIELTNIDFELDLKQNNFNVGKCITNSICELYHSEDLPGILLSGGFDSSIIASVISNKFKDHNLKAFSVGYNVKCSCDETKNAQKIANRLNIKQDILRIEENELLELLNEVVNILEEPFYSTVSISTLKLAKEVSNYTKYVFSGDGSDELFYGYKYLRDSLDATDTIKHYIAGISWLKGMEYSELVNTSAIQYDDIYKIMFKSVDECDNIQMLRNAEVFNRFPNYHLFRLGKIFNKYGVNSLLPFVSEEVIRGSLVLDSKDVLNNDDPKHYLKMILKDYLTNDMLLSKKQPFTAPHKEWIEGPLYEDIVSVFNDKQLFEILDIKQTTCLNILHCYNGDYKDVSNLWGIYMLLKWCKRFEKFIEREDKKNEER